MAADSGRICRAHICAGTAGPMGLAPDAQLQRCRFVCAADRCASHNRRAACDLQHAACSPRAYSCSATVACAAGRCARHRPTALMGTEYAGCSGYCGHCGSQHDLYLRVSQLGHLHALRCVLHSACACCMLHVTCRMLHVARSYFRIAVCSCACKLLYLRGGRRQYRAHQDSPDGHCRRSSVRRALIRCATADPCVCGI